MRRIFGPKEGEDGICVHCYVRARVSEEQSYEANWVIMDQPRCCSDCTYVAAGFKCKVKSCLQNCPWARSAGNCYTDLSFVFKFSRVWIGFIWLKTGIRAEALWNFLTEAL